MAFKIHLTQFEVVVMILKLQLMSFFIVFIISTNEISYFRRYSCVVIVMFNTALYRSAFSTVCFRKLLFVFLCFLWINTLKFASSCYAILICSFVLTLYKNSPFINNKLFTKVLATILCKNMLSEMFWLFQKNIFYKVWSSHKMKSIETFIIKKSATKVFQVCTNTVYDSFIWELSISISTALLLWR